MTKLRVYEYAKQLNMSSKEILTILSRVGEPVANHMSVMDDQMVQKVEQFFQDVKQRAAKRHASEVEKELRDKQKQREHAAESSSANEMGRERMDERHQHTSTSAHISGADRPKSSSKDAPNAESGTVAKSTVRELSTEASGQSADVQRSVEGRNANAGTRGRDLTTDTYNSEKSEQRSDRNGNAVASRSAQSSENQSAPSRSEHRSSGYGGQRDGGGNRSGGYGGQRDGGGNRSGGYGGQRDGGGNRSGGYGGQRDGGGNRSGGYGGQRDGGGNRSGGFGRDKDQRSASDRRSPGGGTARPGNRSDRPGAFAGAGRPSGGFGGGRSGGSATVAAVAPQKGAAPSRKDREKNRPDFNRDRKEQFNEEKLRARRKTGQREQRKVELPTEVTVEGPMTVGDFAKLIRREASEIIKKLLFLGIMATINQEIDTDAMELIADEYQIKLSVVEPVDEEALDMLMEEEKPENLITRPPVVTIMGHVDHGKTTLLDAIRQSRVTATESGGITQHIGAYQVEINNRLITFLDTPGHAAFTTMRARGAQVTDITILVVAADDGVMPQTIEAIDHAKAANVPIMVAINKIDKPDANPDRIKQELTQYGLVSEEWGGDTIFVNISALKKEGLDDLLEMVLLVADMQDLKANPEGRPRGTVIEAKLDKGRGPVATVLVQNGTLKVGDIVVAGTSFGRVRAMVDDRGRRLKDAGPSTPVEIQGLGDVPSAGDLFVVYDEERAARALVQKRLNREKAEAMSSTSRVTLDDLYRQIQEGNVKELNVIVKADVQGSVEALVGAIEKIEVQGVRVKVIHRGAGAITESDVSLASASNAIIIGFHVRPDVNAKRAAEAEKVDIRLYRVIYNAIEELEAAMKGMLDPEYKEVVLGHAEVRQVFTISRVGTVAGCYVTDGKMTRDAEARLVRDGVVIYEGALDTLKRFKDDAREVQTGFECGITLEKFNDIKVGDVIEAFKMEALKVH
ncbi:translation initiation factor IF-2 [Alicyclobacillus tengchongensis]|uniref:Translation initiation factor IF-2 n=2 Tax=Alicyclobacillus tolerans TaxID=90970 RepID=A0ABT9LXJ4_9BACL|nr:translation initiation factor IF-2 [Alicyclobacillus tengchongensis]